LPFCGDKEKENPAKPYRGLPQASHGIIVSFEKKFSSLNFVPIVEPF